MQRRRGILGESSFCGLNSWSLADPCLLLAVLSTILVILIALQRLSRSMGRRRLSFMPSRISIMGMRLPMVRLNFPSCRLVYLTVSLQTTTSHSSKIRFRASAVQPSAAVIWTRTFYYRNSACFFAVLLYLAFSLSWLLICCIFVLTHRISTIGCAYTHLYLIVFFFFLYIHLAGWYKSVCL